MDAISMLKDDHKTVEKLFKRFEKAGDRADVEKRTVVDRVIEELSVHAAIEEQLFYPVIRATVPGTDAMTLESLEEHHIVKWVLSELETMAPQDERFDAKMTVLIENVRHHVEEEENDLFPKVRDELGRAALSDLGEVMATARKFAPTHPHPRSPDTPPANLLVGTAAGVADRIGDTVSGLTQGGVSAVNDVIATVLRRKKPRTSPTGTKRARQTADQVRELAADATDAAIEATRKAKRSMGSAGAATRSGAKRTTGAAKGGARRTARGAKAGAKSTTRPAKKASRPAAKRTAAKRTAAKRTAAKRTAAKRPAAKRSTTTRPAAKHSAGSRPARSS